jgi:hypothetical protein
MTKELLENIISQDLASNIHADCSFVDNAIIDDGHITANTVTVPQAGGLPTVGDDSTAGIDGIELRTDTTHAYTINPRRTKATLIEYDEKALLSYSKFDDVLGDHAAVLKKEAAIQVLNGWAGELTTSGTTGKETSLMRLVNGKVVASNVKVKALALNDIVLLQAQMQYLDIPENDRFLLLSPQHAMDLRGEDKLFNALFVGSSGIPSGNILKAYGFTILMRSSVGFVGANGKFTTTPIADTPTPEASLVWQKRFVRRAIGQTKVFIDLESATKQGDLISARIRYGGATRYKDGRGVYAIGSTKVV